MSRLEIVSKLLKGNTHCTRALESFEGSLITVIADIQSGAPLAFIVTDGDQAPGP